MFIKIDTTGFGWKNDSYWLNVNLISCFIPHESHVEIVIKDWQENLKTTETVLHLLKKIAVAKEGKINPSDF